MHLKSFTGGHVHYGNVQREALDLTLQCIRVSPLFPSLRAHLHVVGMLRFVLLTHFTFMRRAKNGDTHGLKQHRLSQNTSPVCSSFVPVIAPDMHLESESEKRAKTIIYTQLKISSHNQHFFAIFRGILIN